MRIYRPARVTAEAGRRSEAMWIIKCMWLDWQNTANSDNLPRSLSTISRGKPECAVLTGTCTQHMPSVLCTRSTRSRQMRLNENRLNPRLLFWCTPTNFQTTKRHHRSWSWPEVEVLPGPTAAFFLLLCQILLPTLNMPRLCGTFLSTFLSETWIKC